MSSVVVVSDQMLVAETIRAALATQGWDVRLARWPERAGGPVPIPPGTALGVLVSDLEPAERLERAQRILAAWPGRWLVLTGAPRGPRWGAVLDADALGVLGADIGLEELSAVLRRAVGGVRPMDPAEVNRLRHSWRAVLAEQRELAERMRRLTRRELSILGLLYAGDNVARIATQLGVSEATVRSQVRAVLRKLAVNSQLAAVAAYASLVDERRDSAGGGGTTQNLANAPAVQRP
ncbi:helix-turn-helix transcriptional regulator [Nocardioides ochotonae]|uniref:helix-turn-helix transcriptional regulator n=1 Tax=Nocardioides ochotonae TaxID=2685869 RepID=UPI0014082778|nr:LuxR C-terminal-related transcriptional regulator [Nocardioides ochotonae]